MKSQWAMVLITIIILFISSLGYCDDKSVYIFYGNGVGNTFEEAKKSKGLLGLLFLETNFKFRVSYNPTFGKIIDLMETYEQNTQTNMTQFWRYLSMLDPMPDF